VLLLLLLSLFTEPMPRGCRAIIDVRAAAFHARAGVFRAKKKVAEEKK